MELGGTSTPRPKTGPVTASAKCTKAKSIVAGHDVPPGRNCGFKRLGCLFLALRGKQKGRLTQNAFIEQFYSLSSVRLNLIP